jgi:hypothetical protein
MTEKRKDASGLVPGNALAMIDGRTPEWSATRKLLLSW